MNTMEQKILKIVSEHFKISEDAMKSDSRKVEIIQAKFYAMTLLRQSGLRYASVGLIFNKKRGDAFHAVKTILNRAEIYPEDRNTLDYLKNKINPPYLNEPDDIFMDNDFFPLVEKHTEKVMEEFEPFVSPFAGLSKRSTHYQQMNYR